MKGLVTALGMFTVVPVRASMGLTRDSARNALLWLPLVGATLGAIAALPLAGVRAGRPEAGLVGAVIAIALLALFTRGLHLDGLADTADGLGSRAPAERALDIMRRSDIGPFGVVVLVLVVALDIASLVAIPGGTWAPVAALSVAAATGRIAVVHAAHRSVPPARPDGFGALVTASVPTAAALVETVLVLAFGAALAAWVGLNALIWPAVQAVALAAAWLLRHHTDRRFGGMTGDVFGALLEIATAVTLVGLALFAG